jgi:hypothetical protein
MEFVGRSYADAECENASVLIKAKEPPLLLVNDIVQTEGERPSDKRIRC